MPHPYPTPILRIGVGHIFTRTHLEHPCDGDSEVQTGLVYIDDCRRIDLEILLRYWVRFRV